MIVCAFCKAPQPRRVERCSSCRAKRGYKLKNGIVPASEFRRRKLYPSLAGAIAGALALAIFPAMTLVGLITVVCFGLSVLQYLLTVRSGPRWWRRA